MDGDFWKDILNIRLDDEMFQRLVDEVCNYSVWEMNVQPEYYVLERLTQVGQCLVRQRQHESFQRTQPSISLPSSEQTGTSQVLFQNQQPKYYALDSRLSTQHVKGTYEHDSFQSSQPSTSLPPREFPVTTETLSQNQDHLQTNLVDDMHHTPQFQTEEAAFIPSQEASTSEAFAHSPFPLPVHRTSMSTQNPQSCMIPQEQIPSSKNSLDDRPVEPNSRQLNFEEMEELINTFRKTREILGFSRKEVSAVLVKLSGKRILKRTSSQFECFSTVFEYMCDLKVVVERALQGFQSSQTTLQKEATIGSAMDGSMSNYRSDSATGGDTDDRISREAIDNTVNVLPQSLQKETMSLEELLQSTETLRERRLELNLKQQDVSWVLREIYNLPISHTDISNFERFDSFIKEMCCLKRAMQEWLKDIHISETQDRISSPTAEVLKSFFEENPNADAQNISRFAALVSLDCDLLMIWFQKYRQIKECTNSSFPNFQPDTLR